MTCSAAIGSRGIIVVGEVDPKQETFLPEDAEYEVAGMFDVQAASECKPKSCVAAAGVFDRGHRRSRT